jgi:hypothetical protein
MPLLFGHRIVHWVFSRFSSNRKPATDLKVHPNRQLSPIRLKLNAAMCHGDCTPSADSKIFSVTISNPAVIAPRGKLSQCLQPQNAPITHSKFNRA